MTDTVTDPDPEQTALMAAKVRRMMLIAGLTTGIGIAAVVIAIGYRLFKSEGSGPAADLTRHPAAGRQNREHRGGRRPPDRHPGRRRNHRNPHFRRPHPEARGPAEIRQRAVRLVSVNAGQGASAAFFVPPRLHCDLAVAAIRGYSLPQRSLRLAVRTRPFKAETGVRFP